jgi:ketosteroid isomerase-like protein
MTAAAEQPGPGAVREIAEQFFAARDRFDPEAIAALVTDDVTYQMPRSLRSDPVTGRAQVAQALGGGAAGQFFDVTTIERTVVKIVTDGTTAIGLTTMRCTTLNGSSYSNEYAWQLEFSGEKIKSVKEFTDSLRFARATAPAKE